MRDSTGQHKEDYPYWFFSKCISLCFGLILLFQFFRVYLFANLVFPQEKISSGELFNLFFWGLRFDLCVIGFILIPLFLIFLILLVLPPFENTKSIDWLQGLGFVYLGVIYLGTLLVYYFNLPFLIKNSGFGAPYWMRYQDYQSLWDLRIYPSYWHFDYVSEVHSYQLILVVLFSCLLSLTVIPIPPLKFKKPTSTAIFYFVLIVMMARGKVGNQHIRFEDSRFSKSNMINELSLNPLWLIDKSKEQLSQD